MKPMFHTDARGSIRSVDDASFRVFIETVRDYALLMLDPTGRVSACTVVESSGSASLDKATCTILSSRARFEPARDANGRAVQDTYTQKIVWQLQ